MKHDTLCILGILVKQKHLSASHRWLLAFGFPSLIGRFATVTAITHSLHLLLSRDIVIYCLL